MQDRLVAVKTISARAVILGSIFGGMIGMTLVGTRAETKSRERASESLKQGRLENLAEFVIRYEDIAGAQIKNGLFAGSLTLRTKDGKSRKLTFASDNFAGASNLAATALGSKLST